MLSESDFMFNNGNNKIVPPSPRKTIVLVGHEEAELNLANSFKTGRIPHALLIGGPRGIGKATLAYRFARYVLSKRATDSYFVQTENRDAPLALPSGDDVGVRVSSGTHADLFILEKGINPRTGRSRGEITVGEARQLYHFLSLTPAESLWRIAVVDAADEMNRNAANAVLKSLEEPPPRTILILVSHAPGRLLPTIRSRCQKITLRPLPLPKFTSVVKSVYSKLTEADLSILRQLSEGSPGLALSIIELGGIEIYEKLVGILIEAPAIDFESVHELADELTRRGSEKQFNLAMELLLGWLSRFVISSAQELVTPEIIAGESAARERFLRASRLDNWAKLWENIGNLSHRAEQIHLDRKQVVFSAYTAISDLAQA